MVQVKRYLGLIAILLSQFTERIVYYSVYGNLFLLLNASPLCWSYFNSFTAVFITSGFSYVGTLFGGLLADIVFRKSTVVLIGYLFYLPYGLIIYSFDPKLNANNSKCSNDTNFNNKIYQNTHSKYILPGLIFVGLASGLIKSVIASIGADIVYKEGFRPSTFFNFYYWSLNLGSLIAYGVFAYIQQNSDQFLGITIPSGFILISFVTFMMGYSSYIKTQKPERNTPSLMFKVFKEATVRSCKRNQLYNKEIVEEITTESNDVKITEDDIFSRSDIMIFTDDESEYDSSRIVAMVARSPYSEPDLFHDSTNDKLSVSIQKNKISSMNNASFIDNEQVAVGSNQNINNSVIVNYNNLEVAKSFLDKAKIRFGGTICEEDVENVRKFMHVIYLTLCLLPYWIVYFQMSTTYFNQGLHMKLQWKNPSFIIPAAWLTLMDIVLVMLLIPLFVHVIYPFLDKYGLKPNFTIRIIVGMNMASLSVIVAGIIEFFRREANCIIQTINNETYNAKDMWIFYQIPQYFLMGFSEILTVVSGLELACTKVPKSMQGLSNAVFFFLSGVGSFLGTAVMEIAQDFFRNKTNYNNTDSFIPVMYPYFFILGIIPFIGSIIFYVVYKLIEQPNLNFESTIFTNNSKQLTVANSTQT